MTESTDPGVRKAAAAYFTNVDLLAEKQAKAFQDGVPGARVIRQRGTHYIFISNESGVATFWQRASATSQTERGATGCDQPGRPSTAPKAPRGTMLAT